MQLSGQSLEEVKVNVAGMQQALIALQDKMSNSFTNVKNGV
jgi:hypothetical protein